MHVTFVSMCEKRAIKRTRSVLDAYAKRVGDFTWMTPITTESLEEIKIALKRKATRQMAVACYRNDGEKRMKLLWTIGNSKHFGKNGEIAVGSHTRKTPHIIPVWMKDVIAVSSLAGLAHDIGKISESFAWKLEPAQKGQIISDPVRHDLISAFIIRRMVDGQSWGEAWDAFKKESCDGSDRLITNGAKTGKLLGEKIASPLDAILFCILTHHRLPDHGTAKNHVKNPHVTVNKISTRSTDDIQKIAEKVTQKIIAFSANAGHVGDTVYWTGIAHMARPALILADHKVSSDISQPYTADTTGEVFANTLRHHPTLHYNQTLVNHLSRVATESARMARNMSVFESPALSPETVDRLLERAPDGKYSWQNIAADALTPGTPTLVMNIASTGAGKTRMNARAAAVLSGDTPLRFTTVLNLRSLTLQTGDAYKKNVGMQPDELSVVIGNTATLKMHAYEADDIAQSDIDAVEECDGELVYGKDQDFELPEWIRSLTNRNPSAASVMMSPVLVSTIDYIINAADPRRQASHAIALLRLMHSHLIIDEMDGYTPKQLAAVLRLIKIAAMFGKHVIISSGTLPAVIAEYAWKSYRAGFEIHQSMNGISTPFTCVVMDDSVTPLHISSDTTSSFVDLYNDHVKTMMLAVAEKPVTKKGEIITIKGRCTRRDVGDAIVATAQTMHERHAWFAHKKDGTAVRISFGLTRIANIKNAIGVASRLAKENHTYVSCYHARHFVIQRYHIENRLDHMLNRKNGSGHITEAEEIRALIEKATPDDNGICQVRIVVVATPVEEIGRDHDFDWAIIEPSSVHSIVQTAGRVNRHRLDPITEANIAILQFNFNHIDLMHHTNRKGGAAHQSCFTQPGLEAIDHNGSTHPDHDVYNLIDQNLIAERLDASLGFDVGAHKFAQYDNDAMTSHLKKLAEPMIEGTQEWMSSNLYEETLLRERAPSDEWFLDENLAWQKKEWVSTNGLVQQKFTEHSDKWKLVDVTGENFHNALFTLSLQEMSDLAVKMDIPRETAFKVRINNGGKKYEMSPFGCKILDSQ